MLEQGDIELLTAAKSGNQLSSTEAQLDDSTRKCAAVEEQLQELQESHRREVMQMTEHFKKHISEHEQRCLQEISRAEESSRNQLLEQHKRFKEELSKKDEQIKLQLSRNEDFFREKLSDEATDFNQKPSHHEQAVMKQLSGIQGTLKTMMAELCHQWEVRAQQWSQHQQQLEQMWREEKARRQLDETTKLQIQDVQEEVLQLKELMDKKSNKNSFWRKLSSIFRGKREATKPPSASCFTRM
ncbi:hypothetical protein D4764_09G0004910 [Takifugu flavidus]|uniref:Uncharacterized protein n=2 Tax=Takifugu flavidus TaxID=433684 RepID=A0A5C6MJY6_9TELE|nr:hypothetical protein D4764_09G0004910 [Takifugu flavidus]